MAGGLGTAVADAIYTSLAAFGFAAFALILATIDAPLRIIGGLIYAMAPRYQRIRDNSNAASCSGRCP